MQPTGSGGKSHESPPAADSRPRVDREANEMSTATRALDSFELIRDQTEDQADQEVMWVRVVAGAVRIAVLLWCLPALVVAFTVTVAAIAIWRTVLVAEALLHRFAGVPVPARRRAIPGPLGLMASARSLTHKHQQIRRDSSHAERN